MFMFFLCHAQKPARLIFYNVENLFDTIDDPRKHDEEFLPASKAKWNTEKYTVKLQRISKVLGAMLDTVQPLLIGLAEIENRKVLEDLVKQPLLRKFNLGIIHHESPDERGIDVAMLYNKDLLSQVSDGSLRINFPFNPIDKTRDIVYLRCAVKTGYPALYIFVNHWSSRGEGKAVSARKRLEEERVLKRKIEDIYKAEPEARVIVMGDFNDNPVDTAMVLLSAPAANAQQTLLNLMKPLYEKKEFTLKFQYFTDVFDQLIVSKNLLNSKASYYVRSSKAFIFKPDWLLFKHPKYGMIPNRTYSFDMWVKGYSDHLPVYLDLMLK